MGIKAKRVPGAGVVSRKDLVVRQLSKTEWRVSTSRLSPADAFSLLGFIEKKGSCFEAMQLGRGFEWHSFDTLDEAIEHFVEIDRSDISREDYVLDWMPTLA